MEPQENPKTTLAKLLREEIDCASSLLQSLQTESAKLASNDPRIVTSDNSEKLRLIDALQQTTQARLAYMEKYQLSATTANQDAQRFASETDTVLNALFVQLSDLAQQCYDKNRNIGQMINRRTQFITQVLDSLSPASLNPLAVTYAENGSTSSDPRNALLDLARS